MEALRRDEPDVGVGEGEGGEEGGEASNVAQIIWHFDSLPPVAQSVLQKFIFLKYTFQDISTCTGLIYTNSNDSLIVNARLDGMGIHSWEKAGSYDSRSLADFPAVFLSYL